MSIDVVTVWAPRPQHSCWRDDYLDLMRLQRETALRFGHRHVVVTDDPTLADQGFDIWHTPLVAELMPAMIDGVVRWLDYTWRQLANIKQANHTLFLDADCLVARGLEPAFGQHFDLGLTRRDDPIAPINNGAMYVRAGAQPFAQVFFERALARCGTHWGADQEAISQEAAPVRQDGVVEVRGALRLEFLSMRTHGVVPKKRGARHYSDPFVVHFKGDTKEWAQEYADKFILPGVE